MFVDFRLEPPGSPPPLPPLLPWWRRCQAAQRPAPPCLPPQVGQLGRFSPLKPKVFTPKTFSARGVLFDYGQDQVDRHIIHWRHNGRDNVSNHQPHNCLLNLYSGAYQRKHQSSASLAFVRGVHRWPVNSPHKWPVTRKTFPFDDVIMRRLFQTLWNAYLWNRHCPPDMFSPFKALWNCLYL